MSYEACPETLLKQGYHLEGLSVPPPQPGYHVVKVEPRPILAWFTGLEWYVPPDATG